MSPKAVRMKEVEPGVNGTEEAAAVSVPQEIKLLVGETAGKVWQTLSTDGPLTLAELRKKISSSADLVPLAIGWLAREDKVNITPEKRTLRIQLKQ